MLQSGQEIARRFRLMRQLGGRDAAPVWLASELAGSGQVALKFLPAADPVAAAAQRDLVAMLGSRPHPNLLLPRGWLEAEGRPVMVMDYAAGGTLAERRGQALAEWLPAVRSVAQALLHLHARGFVHGDVKAANVFIDAGGAARLGDLELLLPIGAARGAGMPVSAQTASPAQRRGEAAAAADDVYAFGALLCELLSGRPPGALSPGGAALIRPLHPAPEALLHLMTNCLQEDAAARPRDMGEVLAALESLTFGPEAAVRPAAPILTPPTSPANALRPQWQRAAAGAVADPSQARRQGFRQGLVVAAGVLLTGVALLTFLLPARRPAATQASPAPAAATTASAATPLPEAAADLQALARDKTAAETLHARLAGALKAVLDADAASWNPAVAGQAATALAASERLLEQRDYRGAQASLRQLAPLVDTLESGRAPALAAALARGRAALTGHDAPAAAAAFAAALRIEAGNAEAQQGARRAATLEPLLAAMARARALEQAGKTGEAARAWREALALDGAAPEAQAGVARTGAQLAADQFGQLMARAYAAVAAQRAGEAREAFAAAARLRPDDPEIARGLAQLAASENAATLAAELAAARAAMGREQWAEAAAHLQKALALDGTLVEARQGLAQASARAQLHRELQVLVEQPERAYTPQVHAAGLASLERARAIAAPGPVLSAQISRVAEVLQLAATPVSVALRSDNQTHVTLYRVGELGAFAERALQLRPGRYVAVGVRNGYRDVRREFFVAAGKPADAIDIRCSERI